jgi:hypothetical protein
MSSLVSRMVIAVVSSYTLTMFLAISAQWAVQRTGYSASLGVLISALLPLTFLLSATVLEYLEDGNIARALKISLVYTAVAVVLVVGLYFVLSPRSGLARGWHRSSPVAEVAAPRIPVNPMWTSRLAGCPFGGGAASAAA